MTDQSQPEKPPARQDVVKAVQPEETDSAAPKVDHPPAPSESKPQAGEQPASAKSAAEAKPAASPETPKQPEVSSKEEPVKAPAKPAEVKPAPAIPSPSAATPAVATQPAVSPETPKQPEVSSKEEPIKESAKPAETKPTPATPATPAVATQPPASPETQKQPDASSKEEPVKEPVKLAEDKSAPAVQPTPKGPDTKRIEPPEEATKSAASPAAPSGPDDQAEPKTEAAQQLPSDKDETLIPGAPSPVATGIICPTCGHRNRVGVLICDNCGTTLVAGVKSSVGTRDLGDVQDEKTLAGDRLLDTSQAKAVETAGTWTFADDMVLRIEIEGGSTPMLVYPKQEIIIGRRDPNTGTLPDVDLTAYAGYRMGVSRRHASIRLQEKQLNLSDLGSSNGTFLNGTRLIGHRPYQLRDGDEIRVGQMVLKIFFQSNKKKSTGPLQ